MSSLMGLGAERSERLEHFLFPPAPELLSFGLCPVVAVPSFNIWWSQWHHFPGRLDGSQGRRIFPLFFDYPTDILLGRKTCLPRAGDYDESKQMIIYIQGCLLFTNNCAVLCTLPGSSGVGAVGLPSLDLETKAWMWVTPLSCCFHLSLLLFVQG